MAKRPTSKGSKLGPWQITDGLASHFSQVVDTVTRYDSLSVVIFGGAIVTAIVVGALSGYWLYAGMFLFFILVFYGLWSRHVIARERLALQHRQLELQTQEKSPQWLLPDVNPTWGKHDEQG